MIKAAIIRFLKEEDGFLNFLGPVVGGLLGASASRSAAKTQAQATQDAAQVQQNIFDQTSEYFAPYREAGQNALRTYVDAVGTDFTKSPGYQFRLDQGQEQIDAAAGRAGNLFSGASLKAAQEYGQDYVSGEYNNWLNRVGGLVSTGQASAGQQASLGQNFANNQSNLLTSGANAQAAGTIGAANAINSGINNALGIWQYQKASQ